MLEGVWDVRTSAPSSGPAHLAPVRLDGDGLAGVLERTLIVALLGVGSRAVAEQDMVGGVEGHGLRVAAHRFIHLPRAQRLVPLVF